MSKKRRLIDVDAPIRRRKKRNRIIIIVSLVLVVLLGIWCICNPAFFRKNRRITIQVHHSDDRVQEYTVKTKARYLSDVLMELDIAECEEGENGLYIVAAGKDEGKESIKAVPYEAWWSILIDGEPTDQGVAQIPVENGKTYKLVFTTNAAD